MASNIYLYWRPIRRLSLNTATVIVLDKCHIFAAYNASACVCSADTKLLYLSLDLTHTHLLRGTRTLKCCTAFDIDRQY